MTQELYSDARLYDLLFPSDEAAVNFYRAEADGKGGRVLELGCGTGHKLIPIPTAAKSKSTSTTPTMPPRK